MCGIIGAVGAVSRTLDGDRLFDLIRHRGPDGSGCARIDDVLLVHARLAIIDVADGAQPMKSASGRFVLTYNGEIYNFQELRRELVSLGVPLRTRSDSEVLLEMFERFGLDGVRRLRGMFAFAVADLEERRVWLVRDHFGIKPLLYRSTARGVVFASELGAVIAADSHDLEFLPGRLDHFLRYRHVPAPLTVYRDCFKIEPGEAIELDFEGRILRKERYYRPTVAHEAGAASAPGSEEIEHTLRDSVRAHLIADVPRGVFLSGGVDSSLIAIYAREADHELVNGYTLETDESSAVGDAASARELAARIGLNHKRRAFDTSDVEMLPTLLAHFGEPFGDSSIIPTHYVSALARADVKVALSGEGSDEVFAGYPQYVHWLGGDSGLLPLAAGQRPSLGRALRGGRRLLSSAPSLTERSWEDAVAVFGASHRRLLWRSEWSPVVDASCSPVRSAVEAAAGLDPLAFAQELHLQTNLPNDMLAKADVAAMHCALEVRTPFLDVEVVRLARRIPVSQRLEMDWTGGARAKAPLKKLLARHMGADFADRQKRGFEIPRQRFFVPGSRSYEMLQETFLLNRELGRFFDTSHAKTLLDSPIANSDRLFCLLAMGIWWEQSGRHASVAAGAGLSPAT